MSSTPPPIPPRPINIKMNGNRPSIDTLSKANNSQQTLHHDIPPPLPPPLRHNEISLLPHRVVTKNQRPLSSASSSESLHSQLGITNKCNFSPKISFYFYHVS